MSANTSADVAAMVERLCDVNSIYGEHALGHEAAALLQSQQAEITRLSAMVEEGQSRIARVRATIEAGYNAPPEGKCPHDKYYFEECIACYDDALLTALDGDLADILTAHTAISTQEPTP